jgi:hypothetical protein
MENRNGLVADARLTIATGFAEREAAIEMANAIAGIKQVTLGADKGYDTRDFVAQLRERNVTPHVAMNTTNRPQRNRSENCEACRLRDQSTQAKAR